MPFWNKFQCLRSEEPKPIEALVLKTVDSDWLIPENKTTHHTSEYETSELVLRRGQSFIIKMTLKRKLHRTADKIVVEFNLGTNPQLMNGSKVRCKMSDIVETNKWGLKMTDCDDEKFIVTCQINIPPNALVGRYKPIIEFTSELQDGSTEVTRDKEPDVIILFNAWCKDDEVYLEEESLRQEYVLSDLGSIYRGSQNRISPKRWNFGQFEENILNCSLLLLNRDKRVQKKEGKWTQKKGDPVWVSRIISSMVNDDSGVLVGNWSGDYSGGISPTKWNGSVEILQQYFNTGQPVMFGQCWVFSGIVTTILRSLGIPTRSVTNFASAHDTESSMTIDSFVDESGEEVDIGGDSVWNFHVWNEAWMKRNDLPPGYDGWQAVDSTPQEVSLGLYQTGPAPLTAIKRGEVYLGFETGFVFAEVNSDRVTWIVKEEDDGNYVITSLGARYPKAVGKHISTKQVGKDERLDVTELYKHPEGSQEERDAFKKAYGFGNVPEYQKGFLDVDKEENISLEFSTLPDDNLRNGDGFSIVIKVTNHSDENKNVDISSVLHSTLYTGEKKNFIKRQRFSAMPIQSKENITREFAVMFSDYDGKLVDMNSMRFSAVVSENGKMVSDQLELQLDNKDSIQIEVPETQLVVHQEYEVTVNVTNPLPVRLTGITVTLEGPGVSKPITKKISKPLLAGGTAALNFTIKPSKIGKKSILVDVDSKQVKDLSSYLDIDVIKNK